MHQRPQIKVTLFRAIDELSTAIVGNQIANALDQLNKADIQHSLYYPRRRRIPISLDLKVANRRITTDSLTSYLNRLLLYPLAARFRRADIYHITDDYYGSIIRVLDPRRCVVTINHETPEMLRGPLKIRPGPRLAIQSFIFNGILKAAFIVTSSEYIQQHILSHYPIPAEKVILNYYGFSSSFFPLPEEVGLAAREALGLAPDSFILLHVGNTSPRKNIETILRALARLPDRFQFVQIGGPWQPSQQAIIKEHNLEPRVFKFGYLPTEQLAEIYNGSDLLVFPSLLEGFGMPIVEAMASGLPVVTSDRGAMAEVAGNSAELVDPLDSEGLAATILALSGSAGRLGALREAGLRRAQFFSWRRHAEKLCELYRSAYRASRRR